MNTVHLITMKLDDRSFFSAVCPLDEGKAQNIAGSIMDMLADSTGLAFDYEVVAVPYIDPITPISHVHDTAAEAFVEANLPVKNQPVTARVVITPENSTFHLAARGAHLLNSHLLAALKMARDALRNDSDYGNQSKAYREIDRLIADAEGVGARSQSFAEREKDLLIANNGYLERARTAEGEIGEIKAELVMVRTERDSFARTVARQRDEKPSGI